MIENIFEKSRLFKKNIVITLSNKLDVIPKQTRCHPELVEG